MRIIAVVGRKGGIGKTTLAVHLSGEIAARGHKVMLIDADPQGSAAQWAAPGKLPIPVEHLPVTADTLAPWVQKVRKVSADVLVVDCPPHLDAALGAAISLADLAVLPCGPSGLDMMAMGEVLGVVRAVRQRRDGEAIRADRAEPCGPPDQRGEELVDELAKLGEPIGPALAYRSAFVRAFNTGDTVGTFAPGSLADVEVKALADAVEKA